MLIGELARRVGLTTETIRFYEKRGLLGDTACDRTEGNYRVYTEAVVERLETITAAKTLGFSLTEILELSRLWESGRLSTEMRAEILRGKLAELEDKKRSIERLQAVIERKLSALGPAPGDAVVGDGEAPTEVLAPQHERRIRRQAPLSGEVGVPVPSTPAHLAVDDDGHREAGHAVPGHLTTNERVEFHHGSGGPREAPGDRLPHGESADDPRSSPQPNPR